MSRSIGREPRRNRRNILSPCWGIETGTDDRLSVYDRLGNRRNRDPSIECVQSCLKVGVVIDPLREFVADDRDSADSGESCNALYPVDVRKIREDGRVEDARIRRDGVRRYSRVNSSSLPVSSPSVPSSNSSSVAASASSAASACRRAQAGVRTRVVPENITHRPAVDVGEPCGVTERDPLAFVEGDCGCDALVLVGFEVCSNEFAECIALAVTRSISSPSSVSNRSTTTSISAT